MFSDVALYFGWIRLRLLIQVQPIPGILFLSNFKFTKKKDSSPGYESEGGLSQASQPCNYQLIVNVNFLLFTLKTKDERNNTILLYN